MGLQHRVEPHHNPASVIFVSSSASLSNADVPMALAAV